MLNEKDAEIRLLKQKNTELAEALKGFIEAVDKGGPYEPAYDLAKAALTKGDVKKENYNPDVIKILEDWLERNDYDGLYQSGECACEIGELCPCGEPCPDCQAGYKGPGQDGYDFMIGPEKVE